MLEISKKHREIIDNWFNGVDYLIILKFEDKEDIEDAYGYVVVIGKGKYIKEINFIYIFPKIFEEGFSLSVDETVSIPGDLKLRRDQTDLLKNIINSTSNFTKRGIKAIG
jgi:hypothetical protein